MKAKFPFWDWTKPVTFMAYDERQCKDDVPPENAIFWRGHYAGVGIEVTCWQGGRRVSVPMHESWRYGDPKKQTPATA